MHWLGSRTKQAPLWPLPLRAPFTCVRVCVWRGSAGVWLKGSTGPSPGFSLRPVLEEIEVKA